MTADPDRVARLAPVDARSDQPPAADEAEAPANAEAARAVRSAETTAAGACDKAQAVEMGGEAPCHLPRFWDAEE